MRCIQTAALLSGVLTWRQTVEAESTSSEFVATSPTVRVVYSSRTHSQLSKVIGELRRLSYRPRVTVLASRHQLCVHPVVSQLTGAAQNAACRALTARRGCSYYERLQTFGGSGVGETIRDIEDLVSDGRRDGVCPYFAARNAVSSSDVVLLPYNYLIDPVIRSSLSLQLDGAVIVFDESHNIEQIATDAASFDISMTDIAAAIGEVQRQIQQNTSANTSTLATLAAAADSAVRIQSLASLKGVLLELESAIESVAVDADSGTMSYDGAFIFALLERCDIRLENIDTLLDVLDGAVERMFADNNVSSPAAPTTSALAKFAHCLRLVFKGAEPTQVRARADDYRVHIQSKLSSRHTSRVLTEAYAERDVGRVLSFWCFNAGLAMAELAALNVRSMIFTSGTLSPIDSFVAELNIPIPIRLCAPHVIKPDQMQLTVIASGPNGVRLLSNFESRQNSAHSRELALTIINLCRIIPDGVLVFFPSYTAMQTAMRDWGAIYDNVTPYRPTMSANSLVARIDQLKRVIVEPRQSSSLGVAMDHFRSAVDANTNGAIFFAVCRGKVSEGLDFADHYGRAVIITGLPFPSRFDPKVILKRNFLDRKMEARRTPAVDTPTPLSGAVWYAQQATRAVNQAIGRVIRHSKDFAAVILADERFLQANVTRDLPEWIKLSAQQNSGNAHFGRAMQTTVAFFKQHNTNYQRTTHKQIPQTLAPTPTPMPMPTPILSSSFSVPTSVSTTTDVISSADRHSLLLSSASDVSAFVERFRRAFDPKSLQSIVRTIAAVVSAADSASADLCDVIVALRQIRQIICTQPAADTAAEQTNTAIVDALISEVRCFIPVRLHGIYQEIMRASTAADEKQSAFIARIKRVSTCEQFSAFKSLITRIESVRRSSAAVAVAESDRSLTALFQLLTVVSSDGDYSLSEEFLVVADESFLRQWRHWRRRIVGHKRLSEREVDAADSPRRSKVGWILCSVPLRLRDDGAVDVPVCTRARTRPQIVRRTLQRLEAVDFEHDLGVHLVIATGVRRRLGAE